MWSRKVSLGTPVSTMLFLSISQLDYKSSSYIVLFKLIVSQIAKGGRYKNTCYQKCKKYLVT